MDSLQVRCVLEAARTGNFGQAAKQLFVSAATLSSKVDAFEREVGFKIFNRTNKGVVLTLAGAQFCKQLFQVSAALEEAVCQGREAVGRREIFNLSLPMRSCMRPLPQIMREYRRVCPDVQLGIELRYDGRDNLASLVDGRSDAIFTFASFVEGHPDVARMHLFNSKFFILVNRGDPLASCSEVGPYDLAGRNFITNADSPQSDANPPEVELLHREVLETGLARPVFCPNHETALAEVASGYAVLLAPGFTDDGLGEFARIPYRTTVFSPCVLAFRRADERSSTRSFLKIARAFYAAPTPKG